MDKSRRELFFVCKLRNKKKATTFVRLYEILSSSHDSFRSHANFNSVEVGISLASTMLRLFDPTIENDVDPPDEPLNLIPLYGQSKAQSGVLPGGYHYFHFTKPNLPVPLEAQTAQLDYVSLFPWIINVSLSSLVIISASICQIY